MYLRRYRPLSAILMAFYWFGAADDAAAQNTPSGFAAIAGVGFGYRPATRFTSSGFLDLGFPDDVQLLEGVYWRGSHLLAVRRSVVHHQHFGQDVSDLGILYGRTERHGPATGHVAAGIALVRAKELASWTGPMEQRQTVGVPLEVSGSVGMSRVAVGLTVFANVNSAASFFGTAITIHAGVLER